MLSTCLREISVVERAMRSAKNKEERLRAAIDLPPEHNPKLYENVLELAELLDALGRGKEADPYYRLAMAHKAEWKAASASSPKPSQALLQTPQEVLEVSVSKSRQRQPRTQAQLNGHAQDSQRKDAESTSENIHASNAISRGVPSSAEVPAKPVKEAVAPYRPKPLRTLSGGLKGSPQEDVGALQKRSFQGSVPLTSSRQEGLQPQAKQELSRSHPKSSEELQRTLQNCALDQHSEEQLLEEPNAKKISKQLPTAREPAAKKRPDQQLFTPRVQEAQRKLQSLALDQTPKEQDVAKQSKKEVSPQLPSTREAAGRRPAQQLFRPRAQIEADAKKAELRQKQELEEEKLLKEKEAKQAEAAALQQKRQEALKRSSQAPPQSPARLISKTEARPWSSEKDSSNSPWRPLRSSLAEREGGEAEPISSIPLGGRHILELMGIKTSDTETDIESYLSKIHDFAIKPQIRWADNTHALLVFPDLQSASVAFQKAPEEGRLWLRRFEQASKICREISASELQPPSLRPQTTDIVVRRILGHALQKSSLRDLEGERDLREKRKEKQAKKEEKQQRIDSAWGGDGE